MFLIIIFLAGCSKNIENLSVIDNNAIKVEILDQNLTNFQKNSIFSPKQTYKIDLESFSTKYLNKKVGVDCSGFVVFANKKFNGVFFDTKEIAKHYDKSGRRSKAIYNMFKKDNKIFYEKPTAGDLVFFVNTDEKSFKGSKNKENITHIGIVTQVFDDDTIEFIHNLRGIVKIGYLNLTYKNNHKKDFKILNSFILKCKKGQQKGCLTSDRFFAFARINQE